MELLQKADQVRGRQLTVDAGGEIGTEDELKKFALGRIGNPPGKHEVYYAGIQRLLRKFLPKGKQNERLRRIIYDEKNVFLSRGRKKDDRGIRGADGRMGYLGDHQQALTEVIEWARTKQSMADLYKVFWVLNEKHGYGYQESEATSKAFAEAEVKNRIVKRGA
ncbi:MAG: hypothetical protein IPO56_11670 [Flavobacteriales bacterium]|nr:hypothetical protein [Flavobacteriales bacterium]